MELFSGLFSDSVLYLSLFTLVVLLLIPVIIARVIISGMRNSKGARSLSRRTGQTP